MSSKETTITWDSRFPNSPDSIEPLTDYECLSMIPTGTRTTIEHTMPDGSVKSFSRIEPWEDRLTNKQAYARMVSDDSKLRRQYERRKRASIVTNSSLCADDLLQSERFLKKLMEASDD